MKCPKCHKETNVLISGLVCPECWNEGKHLE